LNPSTATGDRSVSELEIDSLTFMDKVMRIEEEENIILSDDEVDELVSAFRLSEIVAVFETAKQRGAGDSTAKG
jgi:acyl carrier protein